MRGELLLLQINDALFPIGGYAHSYGLETYIQKGLVRDTAIAWDYLVQKLRCGTLYSDLLPARLSLEAAAAVKVEDMLMLDELVTASKSPLELREASRKLASRFAKTVAGLPGLCPAPVWGEYLEKSGGHMAYAVCYGGFCGACGLPWEESLLHFLYAQTSAMVSCCVKAVPLRQTDGQALLFRAQPLMEELMREVGSLGPDQVCLSTPGLDLRAMQHEDLYSRLYMS